MLNIEKYEDELKLEIKESNTFECAIKSLRGGVCDENYLCTNCQLKSLDWLLEECEEECEKPNSILTEKEKAYLKNMIKPYKSVESIRRIESEIIEPGGYLDICINVDEDCTRSFVIPLQDKLEGLYKNMELDKDYTIEELRL